jgi:hypothetical protein
MRTYDNPYETDRSRDASEAGPDEQIKGPAAPFTER